MRGLTAAVAVLTRFPVLSPRSDVGRGIGWFSVVGGLVGALVGGTALIVRSGGGSGFLAAAVAVTLGVVVTGALHEDGLADCADALGARTPETAARAAKDPRLGSYGVLAVGASFVLRTAALASVASENVVAVAIGAHVTGRAAIILSALFHRRRPVRASVDGLGAVFLTSIRTRDLATGTIVAIALLTLLMGANAAAALVIAGGAARLGTVVARRTVGSVTGDILGATEQAAEVAAFVLFALTPPRIPLW